MHLVMTLLVRDEEDVLRANLDHHLDQGVDRVIVTDNGSVDATLDILEEYRRQGVVEVIHEPADDYAQARWVTRMARLAAERGADWIIHDDADEFWFPRRGANLKAALEAVPEQYGVVNGRRHDMVARPEDGRPFWERMVYRRKGATNPLGRWLRPKVAHRADPTAEVSQGNHDVDGELLGERLTGGHLRILHFPQRSYAQFENKIVKGGAAYQRNTELPPNVGSTWRWLYDLYHAGELRDWWDEQVVDDAELARQLDAGELVEDRRVARTLQRLWSTAG